MWLDTISEIYGRKRATQTLIATCFSLLFMGLMTTASLYALSSQDLVNAGWMATFELIPRSYFSLAIAILVADFINLSLFQKIKNHTKGKQLWLRSLVSTFVAQLIMSLVGAWALWGSKILDEEVYQLAASIVGIKLAMILPYTVIIYALVYALKYYNISVYRKNFREGVVL